jgi:HEAT repeat protein
MARSLRLASRRLGLLLGALLGACLEQPVDLKASVELLVTSSGEVQEQALRTLLSHGRTALPPLEALLHRAEPRARRSALLALRRLGLAETAPLLAHVAQFDSDLSIRREARTVLERWAAEKSPRGEAAQQALFAAAAGETHE